MDITHGVVATFRTMHTLEVSVKTLYNALTNSEYKLCRKIRTLPRIQSQLLRIEAESTGLLPAASREGMSFADSSAHVHTTAEIKGILEFQKTCETIRYCQCVVMVLFLTSYRSNKCVSAALIGRGRRRSYMLEAKVSSGGCSRIQSLDGPGTKLTSGLVLRGHSYRGSSRRISRR